MGADDYIKKPFSQRLLIERIRAVLRRHDPLPSDAAEGNGKEVMIRGNMALDSVRHMCTWRGQQVDLTVTEFLLVKALADRPGHVKTRNQLMDAAYGENINVEDRTIDSHVKRLRMKFKKIDSDFSQIDTLYGVGYRFSED
jgi:two-component system response regulator ChvI